MTDADSAAQRAITAANAAERLVASAEDAARRLADETALERRVGMNEIIRRLDTIDSRFERVEKVVFVGNGQPSHAARIAELETMQGRVSITSIVAFVGMAGDLLWNFLRQSGGK